MKKIVAIALLGAVLATGCSQQQQNAPPPPANPEAARAASVNSSAPASVQKSLTGIGPAGGPAPAGTPGTA